MNTQRAQEVLYESEAALRLVDQELYDHHEVPRGRHNTPAGSHEEVPQILLEAQEQIMSVLLQLRESRAELQFQVITAQQLTHASAVLMEMERRLTEVSKLLDGSLGVERSACIVDESLDESTFDANATMRDAERRQAMANQIFTASRIPLA